ncbi:MAG: carboxypeptidase-like regulatory domain-containing protein, partial [Paludibacter sp.]|nr:carboxypeptidase-like regulatory domain-containing protein [Paludibacter sp.]
MKKKEKNISWKYLLLSGILFFASSVFAQNRAVNGTVTSAGDGEPLIGVSIQLKGTTTGTITDLDGRFTINVEDNSTLIFSMVGMKTVEVATGNRTSINVVLESDTQLLDQVIVTGYTTQKKADLTGAVSVVDIDEIKKSAENNPIKALQGRVAGMTVSADGNPSGSASIRIRGIGTLNNNDPLFIIDGVPTKAGMHELNP